MLGNIVVRGGVSTDFVENYRQPKTCRELGMVVAVAIHKMGNEADLNWIDTSKVRDMSHLFTDTYAEGDLYFWDEDGKTHSAKVALRNFNGDISRWDTSNVESMGYMFYKAYFNGDLSNWNVSKVKNFEGMFMKSVFKGDISRWDVSGRSFDPLWDARPEGFFRYLTAFKCMFKDTFYDGKKLEAWGEKLDEIYKHATDMFTTRPVLSEERDHRGNRIWKQSTELFPSWYTPKK